MSALPKLTGKYTHECDELDGELIDETCDEFHLCTCFQPTQEVLQIQDAIAVKIDLLRGAGK